MANSSEVILTKTNGDFLYPRTSIDNLVASAGATTTVSVSLEGHTQAISTITGLQTALDGKQATLTTANAGTNISINNGVISATYTYSLPTAAAGTLGGIRTGTGLSMSGETCSVVAGNSSSAGIIRLATAAEASSGTETTVAITPAGVSAYVSTALAGGLTVELI